MIQATDRAEQIEEQKRRVRYNKESAARKSASKRPLQRGGALYAGHARRAVVQREEDQVEKARKALERMQNALIRKKKKERTTFGKAIKEKAKEFRLRREPKILPAAVIRAQTPWREKMKLVLEKVVMRT